MLFVLKINKILFSFKIYYLFIFFVLYMVDIYIYYIHKILKYVIKRLTRTPSVWEVFPRKRLSQKFFKTIKNDKNKIITSVELVYVIFWILNYKKFSMFLQLFQLINWYYVISFLYFLFSFVLKFSKTK